MANQQKYHVLFPKQLRSKGSLIEENSARGNEKTVVIAEISNEMLNCYNFPMQIPTFDKEKALWDKGLQLIAGVDEVGRGCFAGPVTAAAVILPQNFNATNEINDSKLLSAKKREELA